MHNLHAYLAGPDVFYPDAIERGRRKLLHLKARGITGYYPLDNDVPPELLATPEKASRFIADANERLMLECVKDGQTGIIFANMEPFHGPSMDVGTAFEVGFMAALSHSHNVMIIGYSPTTATFEDRVIELIYGGREAITSSGGCLYGPNGMMIESFGGADNLMLTAAIARTGGAICASFEDAVAVAVEKFS